MGKVARAITVIDIVVAVILVVEFWPSQRTRFGDSDPSHSDAPAPLKGATLVDVALPSAFSPEAEIGERVFDDACVSCHGLNAAGRNDKGPPLVDRVYEPFYHPDIAFTAAIRRGVSAHHWQFGNMPVVQEHLTDAEISYVIRYVRELQEVNGIL